MVLAYTLEKENRLVRGAAVNGELAAKDLYGAKVKIYSLAG